MLELPPSLNHSAAREILSDPESDALSCVIAASVFLQDDLLDDEEQPYTEEEMDQMLDAASAPTYSDNLGRIAGLLNAVAGDEFLESPAHFLRMVAAIVEGDIYAYEDDNDEPSIPDVYWALYLVGLATEDDIVDELSGKVKAFVMRLAEEEAEDVEALQEAIELEGSEPEDLQPYADRILFFRRRELAKRLVRLGCKSEWVADLDEELATVMDNTQS